MPILPFIMAGTSAGSSLLGMFGSYKSGREQEAIAKYNAKVARNKGIAEFNAIMAQNKVQANIDRQELSSIENTLVNRGIDIGIGSPLLVQTKQFSDMLADRNEMYRQARIAKTTGETQAYMYNRQAKSIKRSIPITLLSQGIGAVANAGMAYAAFS